MAFGPGNIAAAARPHPGESINGDAWRVDFSDRFCRIAVIDGLGHGELAARASLAARAILADVSSLDPVASIERCHRALAGTRGAAMGVLLLNPNDATLTFAGVGNVEVRLWIDGREKRLSSSRGIVGSTLPTVRQESLVLGESWVVLIHTDGVRSRFNLGDLLQGSNSLQQLADTVLREWDRPHDDATVVVASSKTSLNFGTD